MSLMSKFREKQLGKVNIGEEDILDQSVPTGFGVIDLGNGSYDSVSKYLEAGLRTGRYCCVCGLSGTGKSTLVAQIAFNIVKQYENADVFWADEEKSSNKNRLMQLFTLDGTPAEKFYEKVRYERVNITLDDLQTMITETYKFKLEHKEELTETFTAYDGKQHKVLAPTIIVIDSLSATFSKRALEGAVEEGETDGITDGSRTAIENNSFIAKNLSTCYAANIMIFFCSHINTKVNIKGPAKPSNCPWLPPEENLKGGSGSIFYSDCGIRINKGSKLTADADYGIDGFINNIQILKSRSFSSGRKYPLVFNARDGYDAFLSDVQFLYDSRRIVSAGRFSYLDTLPDIKFTKKTVKEVVAKNPELAKGIDAAVRDTFLDLMYKIESEPKAEGSEQTEA